MDDVVAMAEEEGQKRRGLIFTRDINAGHLLTAIMIALGMVAGYAAFYSRINLLEFQQKSQQEVITELRSTQVQMSQAITRLTIIQEQMQKQLERAK